MGKPVTKLAKDLRRDTYAFLEKLTENDASPGLHIEPITNAKDPRVRTGRVTQQYRAVLFRLDGPSQPAYVFIGVWNHDDAIERAQKTVLKVNPVNGVSEVHVVDAAPTEPVPAIRTEQPPVAGTTPTPGSDAHPVLGYTGTELQDLGFDPLLAARAAAATSDDELLQLAADAVEWQGLALLDLSAGTPLPEVKAKLGLDLPPTAPTGQSADEQALRGFEHPAAKISYTFIEDNDELRRIIEEGTFGAWRVFLHPEQRAYAERSYRGAFRLTGGAGTGKTVVLVHRAATLANRSPAARLLLTTFTTNLAAELSRSLHQLDPDVAQAQALGDPGVFVAGLDVVASSVIKTAGAEIAAARSAVLGNETGGVTKRTDRIAAWNDAIDAGGGDLPTSLRSVAFLDAEYGAVILPHRIVDLTGYLRVRRPGRGVRLSRGERTAVWHVVESYRLSARAAGSIDFAEAAAIAAAHLDLDAAKGGIRPFNHVLIDEAQDLSPTHWQLSRALVDQGPDDLFIAEDTHQRIYGRRVTLKQFGIGVQGRSRRLALNYRTTAQNLRFALQVLAPGSFTDLEEETESAAGYRSARSGPAVTLRPSASISAELDAAAEQIRSWLKQAEADHQPPESIAVLVRDRLDRDRVVAGLGERGITIRSVDREAVPSGSPVTMTMHRAKGTEFLYVLLFGVSAASLPKGFTEYEYSDDEVADALLRERSLLYVAATRARDQLAVSWSRDASPLLPDRGTTT